MAKGENIFRRRDGRWEARYIKGRELSGKIKYGYCYGKTYREAKEKAAKRKAALANGAPLPTARTQKPFSSYCLEWLHTKKCTVKESTYSLFTRKTEFRVFDASDIDESAVQSRTDTGWLAKVYQFSRRRTSFIYFLRDTMWRFGKWKTKALLEWVQAFAPNVIFLAAGDYAFPYRIAIWLSDFLHIPIVMWCADDFYIEPLNHGPFFRRMEPQRFEVGVDTALNINAFTRENYKFNGWNTAADGSGATYADAGAILELTGDMTLYAQWQIWNGWFTDVNGKQYYQNGELQKTGWTVIDGKTYYLDTETGYAATGIATLIPDGATEEARCVFDAEGVFQSDVTGVYSVGADTYWLNSGIIEEEAGLKRVVKENGEVNYYYFAVQKNLEEREGLTLSAAVKSTVLNGKDCWLHKTNGLALPEWGYYFDENGVILHDEDTGKNGILKDGEDLFYYVDGIKAPAGMIKIGDDYYYANSKGKLIVNQTYYCSRMNGLMKEGTYAFDAKGKLIPGATDKNGIVKDEDGVLRYYVNGKVTYVGLIEIDGNFYYVRSNGEVVNDCVYYISWTHGLKEAGYYTFDENGKLTGTPKNGIVEEDGVLHYYVNGTLTYAGLIKIGDDYYYVNSKCEVVRDCDYYISWTHGLMPQGRYHFDADGKLTGSVAPLKNGIYEEDGSLYFYRNGERAYAGLIQIDGDYYYVRSTCEVVHDRSYYVYWTHGLMPEGYYNFDSAGRMILDSETE